MRNLRTAHGISFSGAEILQCSEVPTILILLFGMDCGLYQIPVNYVKTDDKQNNYLHISYVELYCIK